MTELRGSIDALNKAGARDTAIPAVGSGTDGSRGLGSAEAEAAEIARLKELAAQLSTEIAELERMKAENQRLQIPRPIAGMAPEEAQAFEQARDEALRMRCINNLKQIGLAIRIWSVDKGTNPPDFLSASNELNTPVILTCPADHGHQAASNWASFSPANLSYEYLAPDGTDNDLQRVLTRCPIHGVVGLCDGSVQGGTNVARYLVEKDGKLYFDSNPQPSGRP